MAISRDKDHFEKNEKSQTYFCSRNATFGVKISTKNGLYFYLENYQSISFKNTVRDPNLSHFVKKNLAKCDTLW